MARAAWSSGSRAGPPITAFTPARRWSRRARRRTGTSAASAPVLYQYVWSAQSDAPILRNTINGSDQPIAADRIYYLTDANANVTAITNNAGAVQERYVYSPFGQVTYYNCSSGSWVLAASSANKNTILFAGMSLDPTTGLYYDHARWHNPATGAFLTRDPMGFSAGDPNLYRYCGNNPTSETDPSGLLGISVNNAGTVPGTLPNGYYPYPGYYVNFQGGNAWVPNGAVVTTSASSGGWGSSASLSWQLGHWGAQLLTFSINISGRAGPQGYQGYWSEVWDTGWGYFVNGPKNMILGTANMILHPINTIVGIYQTFAHPVDTWNSIVAMAQTPEGRGEIAFNVVIIFFTIKSFFKKANCFTAGTQVLVPGTTHWTLVVPPNSDDGGPGRRCPLGRHVPVGRRVVL